MRALAALLLLVATGTAHAQTVCPPPAPTRAAVWPGAPVPDAVGLWTRGLAAPTVTAHRPARPIAPCTARASVRDGEGRLVETLQEQWTGAAWLPVTRGRYAYDTGGFLALDATDVWDGSAWVPDAEDTYSYTATGRVLVHARRYWVGPDEIRDYRETFTYDASGRVAEYVYELGTPTGWENSGRALPEYDAAGRETRIQTDTWTGSAWAVFAEQTYTYDAAGRLVGEARSDWDGSAFVPVSRDRRVYDPATGGLTEWSYDTWTGEDWLPSGREIYTLDAAGRTTEHVGETYDGTLWTPILRDRFSYLLSSGPLVTEAESRTYDGGAWSFGFREHLAYDANAFLTSYTYQSIDGPGNDWRDSFRDLHTPGADGMRAETVSQVASASGEWQNSQRATYGRDDDGRPSIDRFDAWTGTEWMVDRRLVYRYEGATGTGDAPEATASTIRTAPNPATTSARVTLTLDTPGAVRLDVVDALGRRVATLLDGMPTAGVHTLEWDTSALPPGVYTLRLAAGGTVVGHPVTVVR